MKYYNHTPCFYRNITDNLKIESDSRSFLLNCNQSIPVYIMFYNVTGFSAKEQ